MSKITVLPDGNDNDNSAKSHAPAPLPLPPWKGPIIPTSATGVLPLLSRLGAFLPQLRAANAELDSSIAAGQISDKCIENVGSDEEQYIEMNLGLGVLEEKRVENKRKKKRRHSIAEQDRCGQSGERKRRRRWQGTEKSFFMGRQKQEQEEVQENSGAKYKDNSVNKTTSTHEVFPSSDPSSLPSSYLSPGSGTSTENEYSSIEDNEDKVYEGGGTFCGNGVAKEQQTLKFALGSPQPQPQIDSLLHTVLAAKVPTQKRKRGRAHAAKKDILAALLNIDSSVGSVGKPAIEVMEGDTGTNEKL